MQCKSFVKKYKLNGEIEFAPVYFNSVTNLKKKIEGSIDLLLLNDDDDKSHYVYIKDFDRFMFHKQKQKMVL